MKYFKCLQFVCVTSFIVALCVPVEGIAQEFMNYTPRTTTALDYSLNRLYESAEQIEKDNGYIAEINRQLQNDIQQLTEELNYLEYNKDILIERYNNAALMYGRKEDELPVLNKGIQRMNADIRQLSQEQFGLEEVLQGRHTSLTDLQVQIGTLQSEINELQNRLAFYQGVIDKKDFARQRKSLVNMIKEGKNNLSYLEKRHKWLSRKYRKPLKKVGMLKEKRDALKSRLEELDKGLNVAVEEHKILGSQVKQLEGSQGEEIAKIESEIETLEKRSQELKSVLNIAQNKLNGKSVEPAEVKVNEVQLKDNLGFMKKENDHLKEELNHLKEELTKIEARK